MKRIGLPVQTLFAELIERCQLAEFDREFPAGGSFSPRTRNRRRYWYYHGYDAGRKYSRYVGPDSDEVRARIERHGKIKQDRMERRKLVSLLKRAGLPAPDPFTGKLLSALAEAGVFRLRACLIGTVAYQSYAGLLGVRMPHTQMRTSDLDIAQFHGVSVAVDDSTPPMLDILRHVDATFRGLPHMARAAPSSSFINDEGYRVEFLTPNRGRSELATAPARMPALGGAAAQPLRFLDFLIRDEVGAVILSGDGVAVNVPAPARYAIHKLIVATRRRAGAIKIDKDIAQAATLIEILAERRKVELAEAWVEAAARGPKWRQALSSGTAMLPESTRAALNAAVPNAKNS